VLDDLGCQFAQGYLWARAMPAEQLAQELWAQRNVPDGVQPASVAVPTA